MNGLSFTRASHDLINDIDNYGIFTSAKYDLFSFVRKTLDAEPEEKEYNILSLQDKGPLRKFDYILERISFLALSALTCFIWPSFSREYFGVE